MMKPILKKNRHSAVSKQKGFGLIETIVTIGILGMIMVTFAIVQKDFFSLNRTIQSGLFNQNEARKILRPFVSEVRSASQSSLGAYPIATAGTSTFTFYTDTNSDGLKEQIRYFLDGTDFKKAVIAPSGSPLEYDVDNEIITEVIHDVASTSDIFAYYDENYNGTSSTTPLTFPVMINDIRLIRVTIVVDADPNQPPAPTIVTTQVSVRNLKNNL